MRSNQLFHLLQPYRDRTGWGQKLRRLAYRSVLSFAIVLLLLNGSSVAAQDGIDLDQNSAIIAALQKILPSAGFRDLHIGGGAALSLAMHARYGTPLAWKDIDIRIFPKTELSTSVMERIAEKLTHNGFSTVLPPGVMTFFVSSPEKPREQHLQGYGMRMQTSTGVRFDVAALLNSHTELPLSGYNSAENLFVPLRGDRDLRPILERLQNGTTEQVVARGDLVEVNGHAIDVVNGTIHLINKHKLIVEPELGAIRFLRAIEKMRRFGVAEVNTAGDAVWLEKNLRGLMRAAPTNSDPSYPFQVQEQAQALLDSGKPDLIRAATRMGLNIHQLAQGTIRRPPMRRQTRHEGSRTHLH